MNLLLKYRCLGENVLAETLPDPPRVHPRENGRQQYRRRVRLFDSWPEMSILTQMSTLALLALIQCHVFQQGVSWSLLNLMARQILMACLIFNGFESGATARVLTSFALLEQLSPVVLDAARTVCASSDVILIQIRLLCCGLHVLHKELQCMPACTVLRKMKECADSV